MSKCCSLWKDIFSRSRILYFTLRPGSVLCLYLFCRVVKSNKRIQDFEVQRFVVFRCRQLLVVVQCYSSTLRSFSVKYPSFMQHFEWKWKSLDPEHSFEAASNEVMVILFAGPDFRPDNREGVVLRSGPELREGVFLHLQGRHHAALDLPLFHGHQRLGETSVWSLITNTHIEKWAMRTSHWLNTNRWLSSTHITKYIYINSFNHTIT